MRARVLIVPLLAACGNYNYNRAALVPHATPQLHSGMPLDSIAEISAGASSVAHLGKPGLGDPEAGVEIPGTQLFGALRLGILDRAAIGLVYQNGLDASAHPLKSTQPPVDGGNVQGYGVTFDVAISTNNPNLKVGLGLETMFWHIPYVEYYTCAAGEACFPYSIQAEGADTTPTIGAALTPSYRLGDVTLFGGVTARQHPTLQQKGMDTDPLFQEPEVESGPFNFIVSAGAEVAFGGSQKVKASAIAYWDTTQNPAKYGPSLALMITLPIGKRSVDPGPTAPPPVYPNAPYPYPPPPYPAPAPAPAPYPAPPAPAPAPAPDPTAPAPAPDPTAPAPAPDPTAPAPYPAPPPAAATTPAPAPPPPPPPPPAP
jgi:hypothetical protein